MVDGIHTLRLQGCQRLTDLSVEVVASRFGNVLQSLDLFGCFSLTPAAVASIGRHATGLRVLSLAQCPKIDNGAIMQLAPAAPGLEEVDVRGCKLISDVSVRYLVANCARLRKLRLAKCDVTGEAIAVLANCQHLVYLDVMGCRAVDDAGMFQLAQQCTRLETLDLSSTRITDSTVLAISLHGKQVTTLRLNQCKGISLHSVQSVVARCKRLREFGLIGCSKVATADARELTATRPQLWISR